MEKIYKSSIVALLLGVFSAFGLAGPITALAAGPAGVNLGTAGNFAILAETGISTTGSTSVVGNLGISPAAATYITGFGLMLPAAGASSTSALVTGNVYAPGYANPTPAVVTAAVSDMETAYTAGAGMTNPTATELGAGNIGGMTLAPGLYKWSTGVTIPTNVTLSGGPNDVWVFQIAQNLNVSSGVSVILSGGAQASNVFWVVAGQTTIGTTAVMNGNILDQTTIVLNTGAQLNGRALAQAAVTLDSNVVTEPGASAVSTPVTVSTPVYITTPAPSTTNNPVLVQTQTTQTSPASSSENVALQTELGGLESELQSLQTQAQTSGQGTGVVAIGNNLQQGNSGSGVATLQQFLISQNKGPAARALASVGATAYFGALTRSALAEFQASTGISPALGNFGPITRTYIS
ncbi:MAG TPA: ice-binding family protein, partial [Candidatus Paceibacterota bacterium]|nr:ice-binding family protein [Candidatus Paceibacterota bacterium]